MPDWELYFAYMEGVPGNLVVDIPVHELERLRLATHFIGKSRGVRTVGEFVEMALWERLEAMDWTVPYEFVLSQTGAQPCFFCGTPTEIVDISFEAPFCNSAVCNWAIDEDLRMSSVVAP